MKKLNIIIILLTIFFIGIVDAEAKVNKGVCFNQPAAANGFCHRVTTIPDYTAECSTCTRSVRVPQHDRSGNVIGYETKRELINPNGRYAYNRAIGGRAWVADGSVFCVDPGLNWVTNHNFARVMSPADARIANIYAAYVSGNISIETASILIRNGGGVTPSHKPIDLNFTFTVQKEQQRNTVRSNGDFEIVVPIVISGLAPLSSGLNQNASFNLTGLKCNPDVEECFTIIDHRCISLHFAEITITQTITLSGGIFNRYPHYHIDSVAVADACHQYLSECMRKLNIMCICRC